MEIPYWYNRFLHASKTGRLTGPASKNSRLFIAQGYVRIQDFVDRHGLLPTRELCKTILGEANFDTPGKWSFAAGFFSRQVTRLLALDDTATPVEGPHLQAKFCAASHAWTFDKLLFINGMNHEFYHLLHKLPAIKRQPHRQLGITNEPDWKDLWRRERGLDRDLLPILSDIKFRLQHNGLNVRPKYRHQTDDVLCIHGCGVVEDAEHLFWGCSIAQAVWNFFLPEINRLLVHPISWSTIVYLQRLAVSPQHLTAYGSHNILRGFNMIRCSVLNMLWLHRNDCLWNGSVSNMEFVRVRAKAYIKLHVLRITKADNVRLRSLCRWWLPTRATSPWSLTQVPRV